MKEDLRKEGAKHSKYLIRKQNHQLFCPHEQRELKKPTILSIMPIYFLPLIIRLRLLSYRKIIINNIFYKKEGEPISIRKKYKFVSLLSVLTEV